MSEEEQSINDVIIQKFDEIWFHDIGVGSLFIDFKKGEIKIIFEEYDSIKEEESPITVTFLGVTKFLSKYPDEHFIYDIWSCNNGEIRKLDSCYEVKYLFEVDGCFAYEVLIHCNSLAIDRALSPAALEYKTMDFSSSMEREEWLEKHRLPPS